MLDSGHGGQKPDEFDGDELDGQDEGKIYWDINHTRKLMKFFLGIYPVDHKINGFLRDDVSTHLLFPRTLILNFLPIDYVRYTCKY